jgi:hypothetical protein
MKLEFCRQIFGKYSNIKVHEHSPSGSRVVPRGRTRPKFKNLTYILNSKFINLYITFFRNALKIIYVYIYFP